MTTSRYPLNLSLAKYLIAPRLSEWARYYGGLLVREPKFAGGKAVCLDCEKQWSLQRPNDLSKLEWHYSYAPRHQIRIEWTNTFILRRRWNTLRSWER